MANRINWIILLTLGLVAAHTSAMAQDQYPQFYDSQLQAQYEQVINTLQPGYSSYQEVAWYQNPTANQGAPNQAGQAAPRPNPQPANPLANQQNRRPALSRLSRTPDLFGDSFVPLTVAVADPHITSGPNRTGYEGNIPVGGGARRFKNEQTRALPTDRLIFVYNHFHNAVEVNSHLGESDIDNVDQYTIGFEKTFGDGLWSLEMRMPFTGDSDLAINGLGINSGHVGNLAVTLKRLLYSDEQFAFAVGLAATAPTGSDTHINFNNGASGITVENDSVHLLPYFGAMWTPSENWFINGFAQVDVAANPNSISYFDTADGGFRLNGSITEQTLMYLDLSFGYWWYRSMEDDGLTGLASVLEFHYTTALNDAHSSNLANTFRVGNGINRIDVVNMTLGLHSEWSHNTLVRTALVVPLGNEEDRFFDSEIQFAIIRRF